MVHNGGMFSPDITATKTNDWRKRADVQKVMNLYCNEAIHYKRELGSTKKEQARGE